MANPEHLKILKQGVDVWNRWREDNPDIKPDLFGVGLDRKNLSKINFSKANLRRTLLNETKLIEANLKRAIISDVNLIGSNLKHADLSGANLEKANLREAILTSAKLIEANLSSANLYKASFDEANLSLVNLIKSELVRADLCKANLSKADLFEANLNTTNLREANLYKAYLYGANLYKANMNKVNLLESDMRFSTLTQANLSEAILTGAKLYGSSRDDWNIEGVKCNYVYWDEDGNIRSPKDKDFAPGEFEKLYKSLPIIEYIFQNGMLPIDPLIMDRVVQAIRVNKPEFDLKIDSINARGLAPSFKFTVQQEEYKKAALQEITKGYKNYIARLESDKETLSILLSQALENNRLDKLLLGQAIEKAGDMINASNGSNVATRGSEINIIQHIHNALDLQKAIRNEPSKSFRKIAKKKAMDVIGGALEDLAKDEVKSATRKIIDLGKKLGPWFMKTAAYAYFKGMLG